MVFGLIRCGYVEVVLRSNLGQNLMQIMRKYVYERLNILERPTLDRSQSFFTWHDDVDDDCGDGQEQNYIPFAIDGKN